MRVQLSDERLEVVFGNRRSNGVAMASQYWRESGRAPE